MANEEDYSRDMTGLEHPSNRIARVEPMIHGFFDGTIPMYNVSSRFIPFSLLDFPVENR